MNGPNPLGPVVDGILGHVPPGFDGGNVPSTGRRCKNFAKGQGGGFYCPTHLATKAVGQNGKFEQKNSEGFES